jgi:cytochrome c biogenesis protein CcmG/thiol:disulfide interchange protein DsbE
MKLKFIGSILMVALLLTLSACSNNTDGEAQAAEKTAANTGEYNTQFNFATQNLDGSDLKLADYKGKVVIVDMWDTWCPPCRKGIPEFVELYNEYKDQGLVIIGLAFGRDGKPAVDQFVADNGVSYINGMINQDVVNKLGQPRGIPTTFVIDQNGNIYKKYTGYNPKKVFEDDIKALLSI